METERLGLFDRLETLFWGEPTWAILQGMTPWQRVKFYRDTGIWPGQFLKETTEFFMQASINAERAAGKNRCAQRKLQRVQEAGLNIK